jgi:hypothetical protein
MGTSEQEFGNRWLTGLSLLRKGSVDGRWNNANGYPLPNEVRILTKNDTKVSTKGEG